MKLNDCPCVVGKSRAILYQDFIQIKGELHQRIKFKSLVQFSMFVMSVSAAGYVVNLEEKTKCCCVWLLAAQPDAGSLPECPFTDFLMILNCTRGGPLQFVVKTFLGITGRVHVFVCSAHFVNGDFKMDMQAELMGVKQPRMGVQRPRMGCSMAQRPVD